MKRRILLQLSIIVILFNLYSCKSAKDFTMYQPSPNEGTSFQQAPTPPEHKIVPFDNLYIKVMTLDDEVNKLFNPTTSSESSNSQRMYETPAGQYISGYRVSPEGMISLPIIGDVNLMGLSLKEAEQQIELKAKEYLKDPIVQVKLLNFKLDILGEVKAPGLYYNYEGNVNIIDAVSMANGITKYANLKDVTVNRKENNITTSYKIDLTRNTIYKSEVFYLKPNDVVYIPPSKLALRGENVSNYSIILSTITSLLVVVTFFGVKP